MSYSYDGIEYGIKTGDRSQFTINFNKPSKVKISYKDALLRNATIMRDQFNEPFDIFLSGGVDSEVVVRTFRELGIKHNTLVVRFEDNHNIKDVNNAVTLCNGLGISYKIVDFNLRRFFETDDAVQYADRVKTSKVGRLPRIKWLEMTDNIPIFGDGEPYWIRRNGSDFNNKSDWCYHLTEDCYANAYYSRLIGRTVITDWYEYTPEVMASYYQLPIVQNLINDRISGKESSWSSRANIHKDIWPDMRYIPKLVGYEGKYKKPGEYPEFMLNFQETFLSKYSNADFRITEQDFVSCLIDQ